MEQKQQTKAVDASSPRHDEPGEGGTGTGSPVELKRSAAIARQRALTSQLMEQVVKSDNLNQAYAKVLANKGSPGIDGMRVDQLAGWVRRHKQQLIASLLDGSYEPRPVRGVNIPKPGGGKRQLGIPTVIDRLVQQAFLQVLTPILDPTFSPSSYGFRPGKSAHDALHAAKEHVAEGYTTVVDIDLEKFFDRVNHDVLMNRLGRHVGDKRMARSIYQPSNEYMKSIERISHESHDRDAWVCICGNTPHAEGFYPCDEHGNEVEPVEGWKNLYVCDRCGRIINQHTLEVMGIAAR